MPAMGSHGGLPLQEYQMETRRSTPTCYPTMEGFALRRLPIRFKVSPGIENGSLIGSRHGIPQREALHCHARPVKPSSLRGWRSSESPERPAITYQLQPISYHQSPTSCHLSTISMVKSNQHQECLREQAGNRPGNSSGALRPTDLDVRKSDFETRFLFLFKPL